MTRVTKDASTREDRGSCWVTRRVDRKARITYFTIEPKAGRAARGGKKRAAGAPGNLATSVVPALNTAAVVTLTGLAGRYTVVKALAASYNAAPTAGRLTLADNAVTVLDVDVTAAGPLFPPDLGADGIQSVARGTNWVATLAAAGAAVQGKMNLVWALI